MHAWSISNMQKRDFPNFFSLELNQKYIYVIYHLINANINTQLNSFVQATCHKLRSWWWSKFKLPLFPHLLTKKFTVRRSNISLIPLNGYVFIKKSKLNLRFFLSSILFCPKQKWIYFFWNKNDGIFPILT